MEKNQWLCTMSGYKWLSRPLESNQALLRSPPLFKETDTWAGIPDCMGRVLTRTQCQTHTARPFCGWVGFCAPGWRQTLTAYGDTSVFEGQYKQPLGRFVLPVATFRLSRGSGVRESIASTIRDLSSDSCVKSFCVWWHCGVADRMRKAYENKIAFKGEIDHY